jgi:hypothetical protein
MDFLVIVYLSKQTFYSKEILLQKIKILKKRVLSHKLPKLPSWLWTNIAIFTKWQAMNRQTPVIAVTTCSNLEIKLLTQKCLVYYKWGEWYRLFKASGLKYTFQNLKISVYPKYSYKKLKLLYQKQKVYSLTFLIHKTFLC